MKKLTNCGVLHSYLIDVKNHESTWFIDFGTYRYSTQNAIIVSKIKRSV